MSITGISNTNVAPTTITSKIAFSPIASKVASFAQAIFTKLYHVTAVSISTTWNVTKTVCSFSANKVNQLAMGSFHFLVASKNQGLILCHKVSSFSKINFAKARFLASITMHSAWSATKNFASNTSAKAATVAKGIFRFGIATKNMAIDGSKKVGSIAIRLISKTAHVAKSGIIAGKNISVMGFQVTKNFVGAHQTVSLLSLGIMIGLTAAYTAYKVYPPFSQSSVAV